MKKIPFFVKLKNLFGVNKTQSEHALYKTPFASLNNNFLSQTLSTLNPIEFITFGIVSRAIQLLANDVANVNFYHLVYKNAQFETKISNFNYLLNIQPNNNLTPWEFKKILVWNLLIYGYCPIYKHYENQKLTQLILINPANVIKKILNNEVFYELNDGSCSEYFRIELDEIIWINYEIISGVKDCSMRTLFKSTFTKLKENELGVINAIKNDISYSTVVKIPDIINPENRKQARLSLQSMIDEQKRSGLAGLIIDQSWEFMPGMDVKKNTIDFDSRNAIGKEVASVFGIPPQKLGINDPNRYNSFAEMNKVYVDGAVKPLLLNICQKLTIGLLNKSDEKISFKPIDLISLDAKAIQDFARSGINSGYLTPNEARNFIGLDKLEGGDVLLINAALVPLKSNIEKIEAEIQKMKLPPKPPPNFNKNKFEDTKVDKQNKES